MLKKKKKTGEGGICPFLPPHGLGWARSSHLGPSDVGLSSLPLPSICYSSSIHNKALSAPWKSCYPPPYRWAWHQKHKTELKIWTQKSRLKIKISEVQVGKNLQRLHILRFTDEDTRTQRTQTPEPRSPALHWQIVEEAGPGCWCLTCSSVFPHSFLNMPIKWPSLCFWSEWL